VVSPHATNVTGMRSGALEGIRVIDVTSVGMGPFATQFLGDMGAEVIKVESPQGDVFRHTQPTKSAGMGAAFLNLNRNKSSVVLDLKVAQDLAKLKTMVDDADVFVSNLRPSVLKRYGLDAKTRLAANSRLIHCVGMGYGQGGPYADLPAYDDIIQARCGLVDLQSRHSEQPQYVNTIIADKVTGLTMAAAIPVALYEREQSGHGQAIEVPMFETMVAFSLVEHLGHHTYRPPTGSMGYERVLSPNRKPYATRDGFLSLLPYTDAHWQAFFEVAEAPELAHDPRFVRTTVRALHYNALYALVAEKVETQTTAEWLARLATTTIPHAPVITLDTLPQDPHLVATGFFQEVDHPTEGPLLAVSNPVKFSRTPASIRCLAPEFKDKESPQDA